MALHHPSSSMGGHVNYIRPAAWVRDVSVIDHRFYTRLFFLLGTVALVSLGDGGPGRKEKCVVTSVGCGPGPRIGCREVL